MHLIYLGAVRRLLFNMWIQGKRPHKLSKKQTADINCKILNFREYIPSDFSRKIRTVDDVKKWKATEYRRFVLYLGPLLLCDIIDNSQYQHFLLIHTAVFILSNDTLTKYFFSEAENFLKIFVISSLNLYEEKFIVYNIHSLLHVCDDVKSFGRLDSYSCFKFESFLGHLKKMIRGKKTSTCTDI